MKFILFIMAMLAAYTSPALNRVWINTAGGDWSVTNNWSPAGPPAVGDNVLITNNGTYTVTILTNAMTVGTLILGGANGTQTLLNGSTTVLTVTNSGFVRAHGILAVTNGGIQGNWLISAGAQFDLGGSGGIFLYNSSITNQGTVNWSGGRLSVGGNNLNTTTITNSGLWQMTSDDAADYGGGSPPTFFNSGTIRKITTTGTSTFDEMDLINLPSGIVDVESGTFTLTSITTNYLGGSFNMAASAAINFTGGNWTDAGGVISGGIIPFNGNSFYFRTNIVTGVKLIAGDIYVNPTTFQLGGAITNLTLDGATLRGTNNVAGTLTINSGNVPGQLTVLPAGQLIFATAGSKLLYGLNLINQGTVLWSGGELAVGGTPGTVISNAGSWQMSSDDTMANGGGNPPIFINSGTLRKTATTGTASAFSYVPVTNESSGIIQVDTGTLALPFGYTNYNGTLRLNGGQFSAPGGVTLDGGTLDGSGVVQQNELIGGTVSPGQGGPGAIGFSSGLNFGSNATLVVDGTSISQYDQLMVTGAVSLANCTLQVNALPSVPVGTTFTIINNNGPNPVTGIFKGLPENSLLTAAGGQKFRIHYAGGTGNDVTLVRDSGGAGPDLSVAGGSYHNNAFQLTGTGNSSIIFTIQASTNFIQWTNIGTATSTLSGSFSFIDTNAPKFRYRFYRTTN